MRVLALVAVAALSECASALVAPRPRLDAGAAAHRHGTPRTVLQAVDPGTVVVAAAAAATEAESALGALGTDVFTFLATSVLVVPAARFAGLPPPLLFLAAGCAIGPHGLNIFSNSEADLRLGDFGILFLLFNEGLNLSPERLRKLGAFFKLGLAQGLLTVGVFFFFSFYLGPILLPIVEERVPFLDENLMAAMRATPVAAFCVAAAGSLSSSAFVLPELERRGWKDAPEGVAALSILLLQDLAVAPLLVLLPLVAGDGSALGNADLAVDAAKATLGVGAVLAGGNVVLRWAFDAVAASKSTETFVAATLLVAVGMGRLAEFAGLSSTTGAFAAGVLLSGNRFRAQIQADIKPFEGILLGVFFLTAGAGLDPGLVGSDWPTLLLGVLAFLIVKAAVLYPGGVALGLDAPQSAKIAILLAGGGEFAFIIFTLAEDLGVLPTDVARLLAASVILSMSLTPLLGELAARVAARLGESESAAGEDEALALFERVDADGSGSIDLDELRVFVARSGLPAAQADRVFADLDVRVRARGST